MERYCYRENCKDVELSLMNSNTLQPIYKQYGQCIANQPGWQVEDDIINITYNRYVEEVVPVYRTQPKLENMTVNENTMTNIYRIAIELVRYELGKYKSTINNRNLIRLLYAMDGVNEDALGKFAYNKVDEDYKVTYYIPLVFSCLKRYNQNRSESIPPKMDIDENLTNAFWRSDFNINIYPVYNQLTNDLNVLIYDSGIENIKLLNTCFYVDTEILFKDYITKHVSIGECYYHICNLLRRGSNVADLYNVLQMLTWFNSNDILSYKSSFTEKLIDFICQYDVLNKNRIVLLLHLVNQYNHQRGILITPTGKQYYTYVVVNHLTLAFPNTFNSRLYDDQVYAFAAFKQLINNVTNLIISDDASVQCCVDRLNKL